MNTCNVDWFNQCRFTATDILIAYIPMAWLGGKIGIKYSRSK